MIGYLAWHTNSRWHQDGNMNMLYVALFRVVSKLKFSDKEGSPSVPRPKMRKGCPTLCKTRFEFQKRSRGVATTKAGRSWISSLCCHCPDVRDRSRSSCLHETSECMGHWAIWRILIWTRNSRIACIEDYPASLTALRQSRSTCRKNDSASATSLASSTTGATASLAAFVPALAAGTSATVYGLNAKM